ncbi:MAG: hypothetical protein AB4426_07510 [Xenococcaceae cyanobacterium]
MGMLQEAQKAQTKLQVALPEWTITPMSNESEAAKFCRKMLHVLLNGKDDKIKGWTQAAIEEVSRAKAQALDPVSALIFSFTVIGGILAARVKTIKSNEKGTEIGFWEGMPEGVDRIIKAGASALLPELPEKKK